MVSKNFRLLILFNFLINFNFFTPLAIVYFQHTTGSFALATVLLSVITVSGAVLEVPTGVFSDMIGRKKTLVLGTTCALISLSSYTLGSSMFWVLVNGAIFHGACKAFFSGNNDAYLHNLLETENLQEKFHHYRGKLETFFMIGTSLGALIGGFLAYQSLGLLWVSIIPMIVALFVSTQLTEVANTQTRQRNILLHLKEAILEMKNNYNLRLLSITDILNGTFGPTATQFQPAVYNMFWPLWAVGFAGALTEWIAIPGTFFSGKIIEKLGAYKVMLLSNFYAWFTNFIAALFPTKISPAIIATSGAFWGPGEVATVSLFQKEFTQRQRATIASLNSFISSILFAIFASSMGVFADHFGPIRTLLVIQIFVLPTLLISWRLYKKNK